MLWLRPTWVLYKRLQKVVLITWGFFWFRFSEFKSFLQCICPVYGRKEWSCGGRIALQQFVILLNFSTEWDHLGDRLCLWSFSKVIFWDSSVRIIFSQKRGNYLLAGLHWIEGDVTYLYSSFCFQLFAPCFTISILYFLDWLRLS